VTTSTVLPAALFVPFSIAIEGSGAQATYEGPRVDILPSSVSATLPSSVDSKVDLELRSVGTKA